MLSRDDVIRTAREAWADAGDGWVATEWFDGKAENFERFAAAAYAAGAAAERERIARWLEMQHGTRDKREHAEKLAGMLRRESRGA